LPPVLHAAIAVLAAAEGEEKSKTVFYILAAALVIFALAISALGISRHDTFPPSKRASRVAMALAVLLVAATMASAVLTA
jgi:hypothetical protein